MVLPQRCGAALRAKIIHSRCARQRYTYENAQYVVVMYPPRSRREMGDFFVRLANANRGEEDKRRGEKREHKGLADAGVEDRQGG